MFLLLFFKNLENFCDQYNLVKDIYSCSITQSQCTDFFTKLYEWIDQQTQNSSEKYLQQDAKDFDVEVYKIDETFRLEILKDENLIINCIIEKSSIIDLSSNTITELVNIFTYKPSVKALTIVVEKEDLRFIVFYSRPYFDFVLQTEDLPNLTLSDIFSAFIYTEPTKQAEVQRACCFLLPFDAVDRDEDSLPKLRKTKDSLNNSFTHALDEEQQENRYTELEPETPECFFTKEVLIIVAIVIGFIFLLLLIWFKVFLTK